MGAERNPNGNRNINVPPASDYPAPESENSINRAAPRPLPSRYVRGLTGRIFCPSTSRLDMNTQPLSSLHRIPQLEYF